jgi:3'-phosphoadenosine 5'-phosphosulfate sulfotransferase (PAPS reductase)/FAD synthetase
MNHIVSLSGGVSSAVAANRVIERYGKEKVLLWFADTSWEDEDLYRFLDDLQSYWGMTAFYYQEGRNPLQVAQDEHIIPNQRLAPCTFRLKIQPFVRYLATQPKPVTIHLGLDWTETHRMDAPRKRYEELEGVLVDFPLMWEPIETRSYHEIVRSWGIEIPRLYTMGFPHNNCGGRCVKQGVAEWKRLRRFMPERFAEVKEWEDAQRAKGGKLANYAICRTEKGGITRPLPLAEIEAQDEKLPEALVQEDLFGCFCSY